MGYPKWRTRRAQGNAHQEKQQWDCDVLPYLLA
ncbi:hypothetical protein cce_0551 [Crocosphaera subtropica ATCC 51142]|uniref:Uncharacterized protein n=1 Tax=Crocosphaera subtropica (strain ATCC 51142 / BH68) TaxID=43989 RepID=B1WPC0_CROS5|nr:hypothetical protein cce_0551 [Crocosphaera subtropica ATCC 51142]